MALRDTILDYFFPPNSGASKLDYVIEALLCALVCFMPWTLGVINFWSRELVYAVALAAAVALGLRMIRRRDLAPRFTWAYLPMLLFIGWCALQLLPIPRDLLALVSPGTLALRQQVLFDLPGALEGAQTLSFYPLATANELGTVLFASLLFLLAVEVYRTPDAIRRLLLAIALTGAANALLALAQYLSGTNAIYWTIPNAYARPHGSFVNYNNFSQFMNLGAGAACALFLSLTHFANRAAAHHDRPRAQAFERLRWLLGAAVAVMIACVFFSTSRGGMISSLAGLGVVALCVGSRKHLSAQRWGVTVLAFMVFSIILYTGFDLVANRLATLYEHDDPSNGRLQIFADILAMSRQFPLAGVGLGAHEFVYPAFERSDFARPAQMADSDYFQLLEETGYVGVVLMLAFVGIILSRAWRALRGADLEAAQLAAGLSLGLVAVLVHGWTDFGQHLPAIAALSALTCGLLVNLGGKGPAFGAARSASGASRAASGAAPVASVALGSTPGAAIASSDLGDIPAPAASDARNASRAALPRLARAGFAALTLLLLAGALAVTVHRADLQRRAESSWIVSGRLYRALGDERAEVDANLGLIRAADAAQKLVPANAEYAFWTTYYRWKGLSDSLEPGEPLPAEARAWVGQMVDDLAAARLRCPLAAQALALSGQLNAFVLGDDLGKRQIAAARALAPNNAYIQLVAATAHARDADWPAARDLLARAVALDGRLFAEAATMLVQGGAPPEIAIGLAADHPSRLMDLYGRLPRLADADGYRDELLRRIRAVNESATLDNASAGECAALARLAVVAGDEPRAIERYRRAVQLRYGEPAWHVELARLLAAQGRDAEALRSVRVALQLRPGMKEAKALELRLSEKLPLSGNQPLAGNQPLPETEPVSETQPVNQPRSETAPPSEKGTQ